MKPTVLIAAIPDIEIDTSFDCTRPQTDVNRQGLADAYNVHAVSNQRSTMLFT